MSMTASCPLTSACKSASRHGSFVVTSSAKIADTMSRHLCCCRMTAAMPCWQNLSIRQPYKLVKSIVTCKAKARPEFSIAHVLPATLPLVPGVLQTSTLTTATTAERHQADGPHFHFLIIRFGGDRPIIHGILWWLPAQICILPRPGSYPMRGH